MIILKFRYAPLRYARPYASRMPLIMGASEKILYSARNLEKTISFSLKSWPSERFDRPEMSQIKAEVSLRTNLNLIFHKNEG